MNENKCPECGNANQDEWKPEIHYCEFNKHSYYALIAVKKTKPFTQIYNKAYKLYVEIVAGENVTEIKQEGLFDELTRDQALLKFLLIDENKDKSVKELVKMFDSIEDNVVLIDGALV